MPQHHLIGVLGHVDHGKTALVRALTGTDTDRLPEERRRGISIALGFAHAVMDGTTLDFIDMPGHERFIRTMVAGSTGITLALLVVAANEGIQPQTREHLEIARLLGLSHAVIAISKTDLADGRPAAQAAGALVRAMGLAAPAAILTSAKTGHGLAPLLAALAAAPVAIPGDDGFAYLPIDRAFTLPGYGTVVTGTLRHGSLAITDEIELLAPHPIPARIRALQTHGQRTLTATTGQRVAVNLRSIELAQIPRGAALATPALLTPAAWLTILLHATEHAPPLPTTTRLRLLAATIEQDARLRLLDRDTLEPGATVLAQLHTAPIALPARARFILRTPTQTVAGGTVLDPAATRLRRQDPATLAHLQALATATPTETLALTLAHAHTRGVSLARLARLAPLSPARTAALLQPLPTHLFARIAISHTAFATLLAQIPPLLGPAPLPPSHLTSLLDTTPPILDAALTILLHTRRIRRSGSLYHLPHPPTPPATQLAETFRLAGLTPPNPSLHPRPLLEALIRQGTLIRTLDRVQHRELLFHQDAIAHAKQLLASLLRPPGLPAGDICRALNISRKYAIPLLEHLNTTRFTHRQADRHLLLTVPSEPPTPIPGGG